MKSAVYSGSFDPITNGHLDIIERSSKIFDELIIVVLVNIDKKCMFTIDERVNLIKQVTKNLKNVKVKSFNGLLVDFMRQENINTIVRGLRAVSDFEYEFNMALMNNKLNSEIDTVFMMTKAEYLFLSSSSIKQVAKFGGSINGLVPDSILKNIMIKINNKN